MDFLEGLTALPSITTKTMWQCDPSELPPRLLHFQFSSLPNSKTLLLRFFSYLLEIYSSSFRHLFYLFSFSIWQINLDTVRTSRPWFLQDRLCSKCSSLRDWVQGRAWRLRSLCFQRCRTPPPCQGQSFLKFYPIIFKILLFISFWYYLLFYHYHAPICLCNSIMVFHTNAYMFLLLLVYVTAQLMMNLFATSVCTFNIISVHNR